MFVSHEITYIGSTLDLCWSKTVAKNSRPRLLSILRQWTASSGDVVVVELADSLSLPLSMLFVFDSCFVMQYFVYFLVLQLYPKA